MDKKSLWLYAAKGVMMVAGVGTHFLFARLGGVEGYALLSLFLSLVLIFNNLADYKAQALETKKSYC
jgi:O-antigen/teichoic acid export membrane protein